ncbi:unnamed protein product [Arctogadus glacialis]
MVKSMKLHRRLSQAVMPVHVGDSGLSCKAHTQESMTSPAHAPRHFCGFSQTVAHKNFITLKNRFLSRSCTTFQHLFPPTNDCQQMYDNRKPARLHVWIGLCGSSARMFE